MDLNIDLKNLKIEDIKEKLLKLADKKTLMKIGIGAGAVIIFLIIYYVILNPIVNKKKVQLDDMNKKKQETTELIQKIKSKQKKMNKQLTPEVAERAAVLANLKKQIATAKVNAQRAATIKAQEKIKEAE